MAANPENAAFHQRLAAPQSRYVLPTGACEILLVRHGSTEGETINTLQFGELTLTDPPLLPEGHAQAEALARRLENEPISRIFITPLQRTKQTASPLVELTGIEPVVVPELREVHLGAFEHEFYSRAAAGDPLLKRMMEEENWDLIPGAERMAEFAARIRAGIEFVVGVLEAGTAAVAILHAGTIAEICRQATGSRPFAFFGPENTSVSRLVVLADGRWSLRSFNDVAHL